MERSCAANRLHYGGHGEYILCCGVDIAQCEL